MKLETPTYEALVDHAEAICKRRLAELKKAEPLIRELHPELAAISHAGIPLVFGYGFDVWDGRTPEEDERGSPRRPALRLAINNVFTSTIEKNQVRLVELLLERGWTIVHTRRSMPSCGSAILSKKRVRARLSFDLPGSWFDAREALETKPSADPSSIPPWEESPQQ
ncbi:hypothetical protein [Burkholderia pseudomallei]|uniref:hypothetical protein n=1 Tax=Burkholderia pseudomallei TaxID=28450 RepID=UPI000538FABF|nr:hypothetical protein [Burkholderia pseudomallei]KGW11468.1 hypothetical protein X980_2653 [Burkholderia pseudomallei MSHR4000]